MPMTIRALTDGEDIPDLADASIETRPLPTGLTSLLEALRAAAANDDLGGVLLPGGAALRAALGIAAPVEEAPTEGVQVIDMAANEDPTEPEMLAPVTPWQAALDSMAATLEPGTWADLPDALSRVAPVRNVLENAGERSRVRLSDGRIGLACGFPDLRRRASKVLLVTSGHPFAEIIPLHRYPAKVGIVVEGDGAWLPSADHDPDPIAERRTGRPMPHWGQLFAVESDAVYVYRDRRVYRWDGRRETDEGTLSQAMASLVLRWSQR